MSCRELPNIWEAKLEGKIMKLTTLFVAAAVGAGLAFIAPSTNAVDEALVPVTVTQGINVTPSS